jgi:hypothetical protein
MSTEQPDKDGPQAKTNHSRMKNHRCKITKRRAVFLELALGAYGAILLSGAARFFDARSWPAILLYIAAIFSAAGAVFVHYRHRMHDKRTIAWKVIGPLAGAHAIALVAGVVTALNLRSDFTVVKESRLAAMGAGELSRLVTLRPAGATYLAHSIDLLLFVEVSNSRPDTRYTVGYWLEARTGWFSWERLCEVDIPKGQLFWLWESPPIATEIHVPVLRDDLAKAIPPSAPISGWSAWECPEPNCHRSPLRLVIRDDQGNESRIPLEDELSKAPSQLTAISGLTKGSQRIPVDFSKLIVSAHAACAAEQKVGN